MWPPIDDIHQIQDFLMCCCCCRCRNGKFTFTARPLFIGDFNPKIPQSSWWPHSGFSALSRDLIVPKVHLTASFSLKNAKLFGAPSFFRDVCVSSNVPNGYQQLGWARLDSILGALLLLHQHYKIIRLWFYYSFKLQQDLWRHRHTMHRFICEHFSLNFKIVHLLPTPPSFGPTLPRLAHTHKLTRVSISSSWCKKPPAKELSSVKKSIL